MGFRPASTSSKAKAPWELGWFYEVQETNDTVRTRTWKNRKDRDVTLKKYFFRLLKLKEEVFAFLPHIATYTTGQVFTMILAYWH